MYLVVLNNLEFTYKVASINNRIKEIDGILFKCFDFEYKEKDYRRKLAAYIDQIKTLDELYPKLELAKKIFPLYS